MSDQTRIDRRDFIKTTAVALGSLGALSQASFANEPTTPTTVHDVIEHILNHFGDVERLAETIDTIKTGAATRPVHGIVTTFMATTAVIQQAVQHDADFIITHEPTFYSHRDETDWLENDRVYKHKRKLLDDHGITVWRYHDHIHKIKLDPIFTGLIERLGWNGYVNPDDRRICTIPEMSLVELAGYCKQKLNAKRLCYVGDPSLPCKNIGLCPGAAGGKAQIGFISESGIDAAVCGEIAEWETSEYTRDSQHTDKPLGLIITGHQPSEEDGMRLLADWLRSQYPGLSTTHLPAGDPFTLV